jgi:pimeloyl-ACP methyl ester carboxylesterase
MKPGRTRLTEGEPELSVRTDDAPAAALSDFLEQNVRWTADGDLPRLEHATFRVPADYANPGWRTLDLAVTRIKAADPARRRGILLAVNGGPGGVDGLGRGFAAKLSECAALAQVYDLIGFDPRGSGASTRLLAYVAMPKVPFDSRPPDELFPAIAEDMRAREEACRRGGGDLRPHINTRNTARDIDLIRAVLGEEKVNFIGYAFGTVVGAAYGTLFPQRLDRSVLDSCVHPDWTWRQLFLKQAEAIRNNVEAWAQWTGERDRVFTLGRTAEQVLQAVESVAAALGAQQETVPQRTLFDGAVGNQAADRARWADLAGLVRDVRAAAQAGDAATFKRLLAGTSTWRPGDQEGDLREGVLEATTLETYWPQDLEEYYADMRVFRERYPYGYGVLRAQPWIGAFRSYEPLEPPVRAVRDVYPAGLVVQAEGDPLDNYEGGVGMAERLNHRLITVADSGDHEVYLLGNNKAVDEICTRYLVEGVLPDGDVVVAPTTPRPDVPADAH